MPGARRARGTRLRAVAVVRILGIDPGTLVVGLACLEVAARERVPTSPGSSRASNLVVRGGTASGRIEVTAVAAVRLGARGAPVGERLARLADLLDEWIARYEPDEIALEDAFAGRGIRAALRIGEARGVVLAHAHRGGVSVHEYPPARVKRSVAGRGGADKDAVARLALARLGVDRPPGPRDATDAIAVALCHLESRSSLAARAGAGRAGSAAGPCISDPAVRKFPANQAGPSARRRDVARDRGRWQGNS